MLSFSRQTLTAKIVLPDGSKAVRQIEIRTHPITGGTCRITYSRSQEREPGTEALPPPFAGDRSACPFCKEHLESSTPKFCADFCAKERMTRGRSTLFPNLFPYGQYSAVSLFDDNHFVEIGRANPRAYADSFMNCRDYLLQVLGHDPLAVHMAITQNHLPSAGGSLLHPHLQVQADHFASNRQRLLQERGVGYRRQTGRRIFCDYLEHEKNDGQRFIGSTGAWQWLAAFAPEGFYEIWAILPSVTTLRQASDDHWRELSAGILNTQRFYRSLGRNGYNFGLLLREDGSDDLELCAVLRVRSNYAPWVRSDFTGFEVMLGDMATFMAPEQTAELARRFWR